MKHQTSFIHLLCASMLMATVSATALVAPNPLSLLSTKNVLIINGKETEGDHFQARTAMATKFAQMQSLVGFKLTTASGNNPPTSLDAYDIIIFSYWFDNRLAPVAFQSAFKNWVGSTNKKRGWLGMHTSGANEINEWNWIRDSVTSMAYIKHTTSAQLGTARKTTDAALLSQPIMANMADTFRAVDEWYEFEEGATWKDVKVLYYLDEKTLSNPLQHPMNPHPMAWYRESSVTGNRFYYSPMIHGAAGVNSTAGNDFFASLMLRGLEYIAGYQSTIALLNGHGLYNQKNSIRAGRDGISITSPDPYRLEVFAMNGERIYASAGKSGQIHTGAFSQPGFYMVKVISKSHKFTQRILVE